MSEHVEHQHPTSHYVKIWALLLVLLAVSVLGPTLEIQWLTLLTAFGIAIVKAYIVVVKFMHIDMTPRFVSYLVTTTLVLMLLFFAGAAPDVMQERGSNWIKPAWIEAELAYADKVASGGDHDEHGGGHH